MKNISYILLAIIVIACCKDHTTPLESLEISHEVLDCGPEGGYFTIEVKCTDTWEILDTLSWVETSRTEEGKASVKVLENEGNNGTGKISFTSGPLESELLINQDASNSFSINYDARNVSHKGESFDISVGSFKAWKVSSEYDWISTSLSSCEGSGQVTVEVKKNEEISERHGEILFIQDSDTIEFSITQTAMPFIELAEESISTDGDGGTFDILFLSNDSVAVTSHAEWIRIIKLSSSNIISFEVLRNLSDDREGIITIYAESDEDIFKTITVTQGEKIPHPALKFEEGSQMSITDDTGFALHPVFEDMTDTELIWSSSNASIANVDSEGNVRIHQTGTCTIKAMNTHHNVEASIVLDIKLKYSDVSIMFGNQDVMETPVSSRFVGEEIPVIVTFTPSNTYAEDLLYMSSNPEVAEFKDNILKCLKPGKTNIYVESAFNELQFSFSVFVIDSEK